MFIFTFVYLFTCIFERVTLDISVFSVCFMYDHNLL